MRQGEGQSLRFEAPSTRLRAVATSLETVKRSCLSHNSERLTSRETLSILSMVPLYLLSCCFSSERMVGCPSSFRGEKTGLSHRFLPWRAVLGTQGSVLVVPHV